MRLFFCLITLIYFCYLFTNNHFSLDSEPIIPIPIPFIKNPEEVELGRFLFHDVRLSKGNQLSCASCHSLKRFGGADGQQFSSGVNGQKGNINSPSIFNVSLNFRQFWDGRAANLLEQIDGPINNPLEMASNWSEVVSKLNQDTFYRTLFKNIYPEGISKKTIKQAIISFEKSLLTPNSRFDQFLRGQQNAITEDERHGYELFKQYNCISCHKGVSLGGDMFKKMGTSNYYLTPVVPFLKTDLGRFNLTKKDQDRFVFKVPSLRNIALTAPYFHNGSVNSLSKVVEIMMQAQSIEINDPNDVKKIVLFLNTLTGEYLGQSLTQN